MPGPGTGPPAQRLRNTGLLGEVRNLLTGEGVAEDIFTSRVSVILSQRVRLKSHCGVLTLDQCFSTAGPRPGTGPWYQFYRAARGSPGICHFCFLSIFH